MAKFKKIPVVIDAVQWTGKKGNLLEITQMNTGTRPIEKDDDSLFIPTLEGRMRADKGAWIVKGTAGECYPVKEDIFPTIYEPA